MVYWIVPHLKCSNSKWVAQHRFCFVKNFDPFYKKSFLAFCSNLYFFCYVSHYRDQGCPHHRSLCQVRGLPQRVVRHPREGQEEDPLWTCPHLTMGSPLLECPLCPLPWACHPLDGPPHPTWGCPQWCRQDFLQVNYIVLMMMMMMMISSR